MNTLVVLLFGISWILATDDELFVKVRNGLLKGAYLETKNGSKIMGFMGIPYAKPPLGNLRFQPPVPAEDWDGIKEATDENHDICFQHPSMAFLGNMFSLRQSENCLFLNVYTPKIDQNNPLAVMVWIHGGGFNSGFGNHMKFGPELLLDKDVILVSINYRLGPLGFITTGDIVVPGNMGLKDQTLAIKWVKENINYFGGNPNSITIFGESAGGGCTHIHMYSPLDIGLFQGVISQSGNCISPWCLAPLTKGVRLTNKLASLLHCKTENSRAMVDCLLKHNARDINDKQKHFTEWDIEPIVIFGPVREPYHSTAFISNSLECNLKNKLFSDVPWMTGITIEEGILRSADIMENPELLREFNDKYLDIAHLIIYRNKSKKTDEVAKRVWKFYFGCDKVDKTKEIELINMYTDAYFSYDLDKAINLHKKYSSQPIFSYLFAYRGRFSVSTMFSGTKKYYGVSHGDELINIFPFFVSMMPGLQLPDEHYKMVEVILTLWTNFAKYRNPTPFACNTTWKPVQTEKNEYLMIQDPDNLTMENSMFKKRIDFWKTLEPLLKDAERIKDEL